MSHPSAPLLRLPDELLAAIASEISEAPDVDVLGKSCKRLSKVARDPALWKRLCLQKWKYWDPSHELHSKLGCSPGQVDWYGIYHQRARTDLDSTETFTTLLRTQRRRHHLMWQIASRGDDAKDLMLRMKDETPDEDEYVLARRYHAEAVLGLMNRRLAVQTWVKVQQGQSVPLEEALGAYDLFVSSPGPGYFEIMRDELDGIAQGIRDEYTDETKGDRATFDVADFDDISVRQKALYISQYLTIHERVGGVGSGERYHDLPNNFIIGALQHRRPCLPLQSAAIFCAVARRLGVDAHPCNSPGHVYVVVQAPADQTLDGEPRQESSSSHRDSMYMDPFTAGRGEVSQETLLQPLHVQVPHDQHNPALQPATVFQMVSRTNRNIVVSLQQAGRIHGAGRRDRLIDQESGWYAVFWSAMVLSIRAEPLAGHEYIQALFTHIGGSFPVDVGLIDMVCPLFHTGLQEEVTTLFQELKDADNKERTPRPRDGPAETAVQFKVGHYFRHRRYNYEGFVVGWDARCSAAEDWVHSMGVDNLPRGKDQPFYYVTYVLEKFPCFVTKKDVSPKTKANSTVNHSLMFSSLQPP